MGLGDIGRRPDMPRAPVFLIQYSRLFAILAACGVLVVSGCAAGKLQRARVEFYQGDTHQAVATLADPGGIPKRSRLLYFMEKGLVLHEAGQYEQSIQALLNATALMSEQEIISLSRQGGSLVTSERLTTYKGEYAERLLVHTYLMMNYLVIRKFDDALVEAKQAMEVIDAFPDVGRRDFFSRALIAHCFEVAGEVNGAYIEYRKLAEDMSDPLPIVRPLYRLARILGFSDHLETYVKWMEDAGMKAPEGAPHAEIVVFASQGKGPVKKPRNIVLPPSIRFSFAQYEGRTPRLGEPSLGNGGHIPQAQITTEVTEVLKKSLSERASRIIAKETARVAAKEAISNNIDDPTIEALVRIVFFLMEEPDTRAWETLPGYLTMIRAPVSPGSHYFKVQNRRGAVIDLPEINLAPDDPRRYLHYSVRFPPVH